MTPSSDEGIERFVVSETALITDKPSFLITIH